MMGLGGESMYPMTCGNMTHPTAWQQSGYINGIGVYQNLKNL